MACNGGGALVIQRRQLSSPASPAPRCLFDECDKVTQDGQNKPNSGYFNSRHFYDQVHIRKILEKTKQIRAIQRRRESNAERPQPTRSGRDPGAPLEVVRKPERKALPPILLGGPHPLVRRPLSIFDDTPQVHEVDMEEWCLKPFSTIDYGYNGYRHRFPLLMTKYSEPEEMEIEIKEFHTKRHSVVIADYSHGIIALTEPSDDEFKEFIDLFPEKHKLPEEELDNEESRDHISDPLAHLEQLMMENLQKAETSHSKESFKSSEGSVMSDTSHERLFQDFRQSQNAQRRMTLTDMKKPLTTASLQGGKGPTVWGRKTTSIPAPGSPWTGGRRSSLVEGPMSLLNTERDTLYSGRRRSLLVPPKRQSFAGPLDKNPVNLLSVLEEAEHGYPVLNESSITDLTLTKIPKQEENFTLNKMNRSDRNIHELEKFLANMSDSDSNSNSDSENDND